MTRGINHLFLKDSFVFIMHLFKYTFIFLVFIFDSNPASSVVVAWSTGLVGAQLIN